MSTICSRQNSTDTLAREIADALANSFTIGVDKQGHIHHYYRPADSVIVYDATDVRFRQHLNGRTVREWRTFVAKDRGWKHTGQLAHIGEIVDTRRKEVEA